MYSLFYFLQTVVFYRITLRVFTFSWSSIRTELPHRPNYEPHRLTTLLTWSSFQLMLLRASWFRVQQNTKYHLSIFFFFWDRLSYQCMLSGLSANMLIQSSQIVQRGQRNAETIKPNHTKGTTQCQRQTHLKEKCSPLVSCISNEKCFIMVTRYRRQVW